MNKVKTLTLENGLQIIISKNKKNKSIAQIYIKAGGMNTKFKVDNKEIEVPYGTAHFLEHYLIEQSIYGNAGEMFGNDYIISNGMTSRHTTEFFIRTVHDFEENLMKLLNIVNNPDFDRDIEQVKNPIIQEIRRARDRQGRLFDKSIFESVTKTRIHDTILGEVETIKNMDKETIKKFHEAFYQPSNQILVLTGNIKDETIEKIKKFYKDKKNKDVQKYEYEEQDEVICDKKEIVDETIRENLFEITYKINVKKYTPDEKNRIDYYFNYLFELYNEKGKLFNYLIDNKLTLYSIETILDPRTIKDYMFVTLRVYTSEFNKVIDLLQKELNIENLTEENFKKWQNKEIIKKFCSQENPEYEAQNLVNNMLLYDLHEYDTLEFVKSLNLKEAKKLLGGLNYSNYTILINREK